MDGFFFMPAFAAENADVNPNGIRALSTSGVNTF